MTTIKTRVPLNIKWFTPNNDWVLVTVEVASVNLVVAADILERMSDVLCRRQQFHSVSRRRDVNWES